MSRLSSLPVQPQRVIDDLRDLRQLTDGPSGAERVAWTRGWDVARSFLKRRLHDLGLEHEIDEAGNLWSYVPGKVTDSVAVGSHLDSVPNGGWLDGALGVLTALEILRATLESAAVPDRSIALVDFADEEGARFGRSLFGSSAVCGTLDVDEVGALVDSTGTPLPEALASWGVELALASRAASRLRGLCAFLELHIEQGPVLDDSGLGAAAVRGTAGIERHIVEVMGQAGHAGALPMSARRDPALTVAELMISFEQTATAAGGMATIGWLNLSPGIPTAVPSMARLSLDLRHRDREGLGGMLRDSRNTAERIAAERRCRLEWHPVWSSAPVRFDERLVEAAADACEAVAGNSHSLISGPSHDAVQLAARVPTAMVFAPSVNGVSHSPKEDTREDDLVQAIKAFTSLVSAVLSEQGPLGAAASGGGRPS